MFKLNSNINLNLNKTKIEIKSVFNRLSDTLYKETMGKRDNVHVKPFTEEDVANKQLVVEMLQFEEEFSKSSDGQDMYKNPFNNSFTSIFVEKSINRIVLDKFGFDTSDDSVEMYRTVFRSYYRAPDDYDKDVIDAVHYMRENKCMFYTTPVINVGNMLPDCVIYERDGKTQTTVHEQIKKEDSRYTVIAAFSMS